MISFRKSASGAFTLVELLIGMSLALVVMAGVISCFIFLSRSMARLQMQQKFEAQGRRALMYFSQDACLAFGVAPPTTLSAPTASTVTFVVPVAGGGTNNVTYSYNSAAGVLSRNQGFTGIGSSPPLLVNLTDLSLQYFDATGAPYGALSAYLIGIKQVSMRFVAGSPPSWNQSQPPIAYQITSGRVILRNKPLLP